MLSSNRDNTSTHCILLSNLTFLACRLLTCLLFTHPLRKHTQQSQTSSFRLRCLSVIEHFPRGGHCAIFILSVLYWMMKPIMMFTVPLKFLLTFGWNSACMQMIILRGSSVNNLRRHFLICFSKDKWPVSLKGKGKVFRSSETLEMLLLTSVLTCNQSYENQITEVFFVRHKEHRVSLSYGVV